VSQVEYLYQHSLISEASYNAFMSKCEADPSVSGCDSLLEQAQSSLVDLNPYNINGRCYNTTAPGSLIGMRGPKSWSNSKKRSLDANSEKPCVDAQGVIMLLNSVDVRQAFHTFDNITYWDVCNAQCYSLFTIDEVLAAYWIYPYFLTHGYRVLVYSGDLDAAVPITDTLTWLTDLEKELNLKTTTPWGPWFMPGEIPNEPQAVGNVWQFSNVTFVSIKGAGGMVSQDKGAEALTMVNNFIHNIPFVVNP
jgi:serine carboxypeptidase-like clade II